MLARLYARPVLSATLLFAILIVSAAILSGSSLGPSAGSEELVYSILIRHYGVDALEMERSVTRPMEDALGALPGLRTIRSVSDYGSSRVTLFLRAGSSARDSYLALRDLVDRVYSRLPPAAQRPEILTSGEDARSVFVAALSSDELGASELAALIERDLKPDLQRIEGVGEVEIGGGAAEEIHVRLDAEKAAALGLDAMALARFLQGADLAPALGSVREAGLEEPLALRGRIGDLEALRRLPIPLRGGSTPLGAIASVSRASRERDSIGRVDGREAAVVAVKAGGAANLIALSRSLKKVMRNWERRGLRFEVVVDSGAELERGILAILKAAAEGMAVTALALPLFLRGARRIAVLAASIPVIGLVSAAIVSALGSGLDRYVLSGLAIGIGTMVDTGIVIAGGAEAEAGAFFARAERLVPSLFASASTTLIVLVPLIFARGLGAGVRGISLALSALVVASFSVSTLFVPPASVARGHRRSTPSIARRGEMSRIAPISAHLAFYRSAFRAAREGASEICLKIGDFMALHRVPVLCASFLLSAAGIGTALGLGFDLDIEPEMPTMPVHVECEPGASIASVDARLISFTERLKKIEGVGSIQSTAKRGGGEMELTYDPERIERQDLTEVVRREGRSIPGGFAYLPEGGSRERIIDVAAIGDDRETLEALASQAARVLVGAKGVKDVVLNFKEPPESLVFNVDHDRAAVAGVSASAIASALRWHLQGPVAVKWLDRKGEIDLRIMGADREEADAASLARLPLVGGKGSARVRGAGEFAKEREGGKIYRLDRQRAVYLSVNVASGDIGTLVRDIRSALASISLPRGYAFEVGRGMIEESERLGRLWLTLGLCLVLIYLLLGVLTESFIWPLVILAVIPVSVALPLAILAVAGRRIVAPVLVGLVILSGMAVNNSILIVDAFRARGGSGSAAIRGALTSRLSALTATTATTLAGLVPLLLTSGGGNTFMRSLAFVMFWGLLGSYLATLTCIPALLSFSNSRICGLTDRRTEKKI